MEKEKHLSKEEYKKEIVKLLSHLDDKYGRFKVFEDLLYMIACSISNAIDGVHYEGREETYVKLMSHYSSEERMAFVDLTNLIISAMTVTMYSADLLGEIYHEMNLYNEHNGQYFTPINVCQLMAEIVFSDEDIKKHGYISVHEPTCGSGAMLIATANVLYSKKYNPNCNMCCFAVDNDIRCVLMTYIQLSLLGIPAVVVHGDTLTRKEYERFYTPMYVLDGWIWREKLGLTDDSCEDDEKLKCILEPLYFAVKCVFDKN